MSEEYDNGEETNEDTDFDLSLDPTMFEEENEEGTPSQEPTDTFNFDDMDLFGEKGKTNTGIEKEEYTAEQIEAYNNLMKDFAVNNSIDETGGIAQEDTSSTDEITTMGLYPTGEPGPLEARTILNKRTRDIVTGLDAVIETHLTDNETEQDDNHLIILDNDLEIDSMKGELEAYEAEMEMDIHREIPNIPTQTLDEYILIRGMYSTPFKEYISSHTQVQRGDFPLAIEVGGNTIMIAKIHPEPKTIFYLKHILKGFEILLVKDGVETDLDVYHFLGKIQIKM